MAEKLPIRTIFDANILHQAAIVAALKSKDEPTFANRTEAGIMAVMLNPAIIFFGKTLSRIFRLLNLGNGSTWPGHIALGANKKFIQQMVAKSHLKIIVITGTNGKTTTAKLIQGVLKANGNKVLVNES